MMYNSRLTKFNLTKNSLQIIISFQIIHSFYLILQNFSNNDVFTNFSNNFHCDYNVLLGQTDLWCRRCYYYWVKYRDRYSCSRSDYSCPVTMYPCWAFNAFPQQSHSGRTVPNHITAWIRLSSFDSSSSYIRCYTRFAENVYCQTKFLMNWKKNPSKYLWWIRFCDKKGLPLVSRTKGSYKLGMLTFSKITCSCP